MLSKAIEMIEKQQGKADSRSHVFFIGEQLKDICRADPSAAELVAQDLENETMGLLVLKRKFDEFAQANRKGNQAIITPAEADELIRKFYGIAKDGDAPAHKAVQEKQPSKVLSLFDFI